MTVALCSALTQFLKSNGVNIKLPTQISSFLFISMTGVTGEPQHAEVGHSFYNSLTDDAEYTCTLKKKE
jgi:hypothetical protein